MLKLPMLDRLATAIATKEKLYSVSGDLPKLRNLINDILASGTYLDVKNEE